MKNKIIILFYILLCIINYIYTDDMNDNSIKDNKFTLQPNSQNVKNIGRFFIKNDIIFLAQSGSAIEFYLKAKSAEITLVGDGFSIYHEEYEKPRYAIYINEKLLLDTTIRENEKNISLFNNESEQQIKVKIIILTEAIFGCIGIKNINVISSFSIDEVIKPTKKKLYTIEFIGDSITCAYGIEAKAPNELFDTRTQNFEKSFAFLSAKELNYDYNVVCYSGCGIISTGNIMSERYTKINYFFNDKEWDFENYHNDIVVINLGTNDFGYVWGFRIDEYVDEYAEFLKLVREKNPDAYIICILGMMGCNALFPLINEAINILGDYKIFAFLLPEQKIEDGIGAEYHPNYVSHSKWGKLLSEIIKNVMNY